MGLVERVKNICLTPNTEWPVIAGETATAGGLITGYVAPLAAIGAVAGFIGGSLVGRSLPFIGSYRVPIVAGLGAAVFTFVMAIVGILVLSFVINALAPTFGGEKNSSQAMKVAVYSYTPAWVAGILRIVPTLGVLGVLAGLYGLYLLYLGLPRLMKCRQDKAIGYTVVVVVCAIVLSVVITAVGALVVGAGAIGGAALGSPSTRGEAEFDKDSPLGKLQQLGKSMEQSNKEMEAAEKRGDQAGQVTAAMKGLGTLFGGGKRVDPIGVDQLKSFVPETFAGLPKKSSNAEKNGIAGLMVSKAAATYSNDGGKSVTLEVTDTGGVSGIMGLASWVGMQGEKEDENGSERTTKQNGRLIHEKISKTGGTNEFGVVLGDRFVVSATGRGVPISELKSAVSSIDLAKLESMKGVGVTK
jgi:Yip1 domain